MRDWAIDYITHAIEAKGWSMSRLAQEAGVAASTINRPLRDPDWPHKLNRTTIAKIRSATGIDPTPFIPADSAEDQAFFASEGVEKGPVETAPQPKPGEVYLVRDSKLNQLSIMSNGELIQITGTFNREGLKKLQERITNIVNLMDDD